MADRKVRCVCGGAHFERGQSWLLAKHGGAASNAVSVPACGAFAPAVVAEAVDTEELLSAAVPDEPKKKQRWDRDKYNENAAKYMREYRKRGKAAS